MEQRDGPKDPVKRHGKERRKFPRVGVKFKVTLAFKGGQTEGVGTLINLSMGGYAMGGYGMGGCAIKSTTRVEKGAFLEVFLHMPGSDQTVRIEVTRVCWTQRGAFGVEFYAMVMGQEERTKLGLLVQEVKSRTSLPPSSRGPA